MGLSQAIPALFAFFGGYVLFTNHALEASILLPGIVLVAWVAILTTAVSHGGDVS